MPTHTNERNLVATTLAALKGWMQPDPDREGGNVNKFVAAAITAMKSWGYRDVERIQLVFRCGTELTVPCYGPGIHELLDIAAGYGLRDQISSMYAIDEQTRGHKAIFLPPLQHRSELRFLKTVTLADWLRRKEYLCPVEALV
jgi:hypothetical protein